jgi:hypothetical protein
VALSEVTFDGGDLHSEVVVGEGFGDPAREVPAGEVIGEDAGVAVLADRAR